MDAEVKETKRMSPLKKAASVNEFGILIALIVLCVVLGLANPVFFTFGNAMNVLRQITLVAIMAVGEAFIIITGGIDLSVGSTMTLSGIMMAFFVASGVDPTAALVLTLGVGLLCGLCNSLLIVKLNLNAFITTLATMNIIKGFAYLVTGGLPIKFDSYINFIGNGTIGGADGVPVYSETNHHMTGGYHQMYHVTDLWEAWIDLMEAVRQSEKEDGIKHR